MARKRTRSIRQDCRRVRALTNLPFSLTQLDHVELFVPDRAEAAAWYARALGMHPVPGTEGGAEDPRGPLMIATDDGARLALFQGQPQGPRPTAGWHRVAFRVDARGFLAFLEHARALGLRERGKPLRIRDHGTAFSAYFADPYGHRLEVTTYEHASVRAGLPAAQSNTPGGG